MLRGGDVEIDDICRLDDVRDGAIGYVDDPRRLASLESWPSALIASEKAAGTVPEPVAVIVASTPNVAFAAVGRHLFDESRDVGISPTALIDPSARLEDDVAVGPGAVIGPDVEIGWGTSIGAGASIGRSCRVGRECSIGPNAVVTATLMGNRVEVQAGATVGEPGFGYVPGPRGIERVVQIGRVVLQDDVHVGSNCCIDRGSVGDTVIGEGTKIGNLQQIAHNVRIGRHTIVVGNGGIAGSAVIGDGVTIAGGVFVTDHARVGDGATLAGVTMVTGSVPPGVTWGGIPARPIAGYLRDMAEASAKAKRRERGRDDRD